MTVANIQSQLYCERPDDELPEGAKNSAAAGVQLMQMFSSTSALLGLSRSSDYAALNANLNELVQWRRTQNQTGQANMWGEVKGVGLAGSGTGASGQHGQAAAAPSETTYMQSRQAPAARPSGSGKQVEDDVPPEYYQRDPASAELVISHREMSTASDMEHKTTFRSVEAEGFMPVRGLQVSMKTVASDDKVLVFCNIPTAMTEMHDGVTWTLKRGTHNIGPQHANWTRELGRVENVLMPWLDEPGKAKFEVQYSANGRLKGSVKVSPNNDKRQLTAVLIPGGQVTVGSGSESLSVTPGRWHDVPGLQQISVTNENEKVLVICTMKYQAMWSDEMTRGRFSIFRDGKQLDVNSYGLQSVRAVQRGIKRSLVMALVDDPEAGPHLYTTRAAVTTEEKQTAVCHIEEEQRQLALIRLPGELVFGPNRCDGETTVDEDRWTEIKGMTVTATVSHPSDKLMIVYNTNFNPAGTSYETYFTVFRQNSAGAMKNLGDDEQGMTSVASSAAGSSEYPVGMFTDMPGAGTFTYTIHARSKRCDNLTAPQQVEVGPDGQVAAVLLPAKKRTGTALLERMAQEMEAAAPPADEYNELPMPFEEAAQRVGLRMAPGDGFDAAFM